MTRFLPEHRKFLREKWKEAWTPPKRLNCWQWAEENVFLPPRASPKPGKYSTELTPYVRVPMECYSDKPTREITLCWSAQSSKTTTELVCMLFNTANNPGNQIFLMPSQDMAKSFSETRFQPIIDSSPEVAKHKPSDRHKYKMLEMHFATGTVNFIGGSSAANLAGRSAGFLFMDEIDKLQAKLKDEADPISLLRERAKWFPNRKVFLTSTPTVDDGHVWKAFLEGSQEYYYWPCPHCGHKFTPKWHEHVKFPNKYGRFDDEGQEGDSEVSFSKRGEMSYIECPECEGKIVNKHKRKMLAEGEWVAHNEDAPTEKRSFHFNEIMSPITPLPKLVLKFLEAQDKAKKGDLGELQNFVNSSLSEPWRYEPANTLKDSDIENLVDIDRPRFEVPAQAHGLIAGVDTQDNGFYFVIRAFGAHNSSWLVHEGFVTDLHALEQVLFNSQYDNYSVGMVLIDSQGHRTDEIHQWCRRHINRAIPAVGRDSASMSQDFNYSQVDRGRNGQKVIGGLQRVLWNTVSIKDQLFYKMRVEQNLPGEWRLHKDVSRFYKKNLRSEYKNEKGTYDKRANYENHLLDCFEEGTEVLTDQGWVDFRDWDGQKVATMNLDNNSFEFQTPTHYINKPYEGKMIHIKTRTLNLKVTPNHRMVVDEKKYTRETGKHYKERTIRLAKDLKKWDTLVTKFDNWEGDNSSVLIKGFKSSNGISREPRMVNRVKLARLLGWYISEGSLGKGRVVIAQEKPHTRKIIEDDLRKWGDLKYSGHQYHMYDTALERFVRENNFGEYSYTKRLPNWFKNSSKEVLEAFLETYLLGDGWVQKNNKVCATVSKQLADDLCEIALKVGYRPTIRKVQPKGWKIQGRSGSCRLQYWVFFNTAKGINIRRSDNTQLTKEVEYKGRVYCLTVPNGTLVVRKDGKTLIAGNCEAMAYLGAVITGIQNLRPPERGHVERRDINHQVREDNHKW